MDNSKVLYVGMDVDKEKIAMAALERNSNEFVSEQLVRNIPTAVAKYFHKLMAAETEVIACYEAGCFGFRLARQLSDLGIGCAVAAPGMLPKKPSDRVKTDRRDGAPRRPPFLWVRDPPWQLPVQPCSEECMERGNPGP